MTEFDTLRVETDGAVGRLTLDNPTKLNPLSAACLLEIVEAARWFDAQPGLKVVIVSGAGRAFTAGAGLAAFTAAGSTPPRAAADAGRRMGEAVEGMQAVTIAAIHGHCVGGGVLLALNCDLRVAAQGARFSIPEVDLGIPLAWGGIPRLVREIGPAATRDLVLTCRPFGADEARALGLVNRVVGDAELVEHVDTLAKALAAKSTYVLGATLQAVEAAAESLVSTHFAWSDADALVTALHDPESREVARNYLAQRRR